MEMIEGEMNNFIMVWSVAMILFCYSYTIGKLNVPKGISRLVALLPSILILLLLPLRLTSITLVGLSSFFLSWLSTFKLVLFSFSKGPLSSNPPLSLIHFLLLASFPIKFLHKSKSNHNQFKAISLINWPKLTCMVIFYTISFKVKQSFHPIFTTLLFTINVYIGLEIPLVLFTSIIHKLVTVELEQPFDKPHLSTSLQDFWGRRWNIMVTRILHPTIYEPMVKATSHIIGRKWAPLPAVVVTFAVSGLMHELIFFYIKYDNEKFNIWEPNWDSIWFFLIHGVCVAVQIGYRKAFEPKQPLIPTLVSRILTITFVVLTSVCLFVPAYLRCDAIEKSTRDYFDVLHLVNNVYHHYI